MMGVLVLQLWHRHGAVSTVVRGKSEVLRVVENVGPLLVPLPCLPCHRWASQDYWKVQDARAVLNVYMIRGGRQPRKRGFRSFSLCGISDRRFQNSKLGPACFNEISLLQKDSVCLLCSGGAAAHHQTRDLLVFSRRQVRQCTVGHQTPLPTLFARGTPNQLCTRGVDIRLKDASLDFPNNRAHRRTKREDLKTAKPEVRTEDFKEEDEETETSQGLHLQASAFLRFLVAHTLRNRATSGLASSPTFSDLALY